MNRTHILPAWLGTAALAAGLLATSSAHALLLIERPTGMGPKQIHTFDDSAGYDMSAPRVQIGAAYGVDLGVTARHGTLSFGAASGAWGLGSNGEWTSAKTFVGVDGGVDGTSVASLVFDFGGKAVRGVGARINYLPDLLTDTGVPLQVVIAAYDRKGNLLEDYSVPVSTPGRIDRGVFYGILRDKPSIGSFQVIAPYAVVDDLKFTAPVPEPASYAMLLAGLGAVAWVVRRRRVS